MRVVHPEAAVELTDLPDGRLDVETSPELPAALAELVANSVEHGVATDGGLPEAAP